MKDEIIGGLRNALEHGYSLEQAAQSFINAGYNASEVQDAARDLSSGAISILNKGNKSIIESLESQPKKSPFSFFKQQNQPVLPQTQQVQNQAQRQFPLNPAKDKSEFWKKILISLTVVIAFLIAMLILLIVFGRQILDNLFG